MSDLKKIENILNKQLLNKTIKTEVIVDGISLCNITSKDLIGGILEQVVFSILKNNGMNIEKNKASQTFPDYIVDEKENLELKCFDLSRGPNFDLFNFGSMFESLTTDPQLRLLADYLILGYIFDENTNSFKVEKMYFRKLHEICSKRETSKNTDQLNLPLKCQVKRGIIYNVRPVFDFNLKPNDPKVIKNEEELIRLIAECQFKVNPSFNKKEWLSKVLNIFNQQRSTALNDRNYNRVS